HFVSGGRFRLDGGAMFGVVPKVLWNKVAPADERNRIRLAMNCLLIEGDGKHVLVDTGVGTKNDPKFRDIFAVERPESLLEDLAALGIKPEDVTTVATTHLHFDHCGGGTTRCARPSRAPITSCGARSGSPRIRRTSEIAPRISRRTTIRSRRRGSWCSTTRTSRSCPA